MNQVTTAANHFINLYSEEIEAGEITKDVVFEWWTQTKEQYPDLKYEDIENEIFTILFF